jgi:hypothetical protein
MVSFAVAGLPGVLNVVEHAAVIVNPALIAPGRRYAAV